MVTRPISIPANTPVVSAFATWALHLTAFILPLVTLSFLVTGPHSWWLALAWGVGPIVVLVLTDNAAPPDKRQPPANLPRWPFDVQVWLLSALQITNHVLAWRMASHLSFGSWQAAGVSVANIVGIGVLGGVTAGYSGIVLAHELVHRRNRFEFNLGRLLLAFVSYEQFATEHVRGHHPRLGTMEDPATARFEETMKEFFRRTVPGQFKSAWHLEKVRLGLTPGASMSFFDLRMLQHRVLQGVVVEIGIAATAFALFGPIALAAFLVQSYTAILMLETVNYIEHWGIQRTTRRVTTVDSWDTDNAVTLRTLIGLSRHADHHSQAARPYQELRYFEESPKMPLGYYGTIVMALFANDMYQERAKAELQKRGLGPYKARTPSDALAGADPVPAE
jgi:alkane 1-monooxygenase